MKEYILTFQRPGQAVETRHVFLDTKQELLAIAGQGHTDKNGIKLIKAEPVDVKPAQEIRRAAEMHPIFKQILKPWMP